MSENWHLDLWRKWTNTFWPDFQPCSLSSSALILNDTVIFRDSVTQCAFVFFVFFLSSLLPFQKCSCHQSCPLIQLFNWQVTEVGCYCCSCWLVPGFCLCLWSLELLHVLRKYTAPGQISWACVFLLLIRERLPGLNLHTDRSSFGIRVMTF